MTAPSGHRNPSSDSSSAEPSVDRNPSSAAPLRPLLNLSALGHRIATIRRSLSAAVASATTVPDARILYISQELGNAVHDVILNAAALLASAHALTPPPPPQFEPKPADPSSPRPQIPAPDADAGDADDADCEIVEIDEAELMAEHVHFCEVCGKGFRRDANLRMHMRAHGDQFKTLEALSKPDRNRAGGPAIAEGAAGKMVRFSCPFVGCNRNRGHKKFRPLKSAICAKNHFKRSHCPKVYSCHRCNKKNFSVLADLRNHVKHCGESRWRCSCGTTFSRKDKLFGHVALFEGHMPAVGGSEEEGKGKGVGLGEKEEGKGQGIGESELIGEGFNSLFFKQIEEEFDEIERGNWMSS